MIDIVSKVMENVERSRKNFPCKSNRASSMGYYVPMLGGCVRQGVYERTAWDQKEPYSAETLLIFEEGNRQERHVLSDLANAGIDVIEQQACFEWPEQNITGHIDGVIIVDNKPLPLEIKSMNPNIFAGIKSLDDFYKKPWTTAYLAQITLYMMHKNVEQAIFILKDKSSGKMKQVIVDLDYDLGESCLKTAEEINKHVDNKTLPGRIGDRKKCADCKYKLLCLPDIEWGVPLKILDDPKAESKIDRYLDIKESSNECKALWDELKSEFKSQASGGDLNVMLGKYHVTGKTGAKGVFRSKVEVI